MLTLPACSPNCLFSGPGGSEFFNGVQNVLERGTEHPGVGRISSSQPGLIGLLGNFKPCAVTGGRGAFIY